VREAFDPARPVALVTGGSRGLGLAFARQAVACGFQTFIVGRDASAVDAAARAVGEECLPLVADLTSAAQVAALVASVNARAGRLDLLINNVGSSDRGAADAIADDRIRALFDQNLLTTIHAVAGFLPLLEGSRGTIVNVGSLAGKVGARFLGGYVAAKHALHGWTQQLRLELRGKGIHVLLVAPGPIRRTDAGTRYGLAFADGTLPPSAARPGGGTSFKGLDPDWVARQTLRAAKKRKPELILPRWLRLLVVLGNASPRLGDWLVLRITK
jgi:uncharacterized protein